jgi:F0F1-type ATP synthase epsilon subunit
MADKRNPLTVTIKRPEKVEFLGNARAVTSMNMKGPFDVLAYHTNFITLIRDKVTIHVESKDPVTYNLQAGIIKVTENQVTILIGIETHVY